MAEMEPEKRQRGGGSEVMWQTAKYWQRIMHIDIDDPVKQYYG
jgi:hypothetical protein